MFLFSTGIYVTWECIYWMKSLFSLEREQTALKSYPLDNFLLGLLLLKVLLSKAAFLRRKTGSEIWKIVSPDKRRIALVPIREGGRFLGGVILLGIDNFPPITPMMLITMIPTPSMLFLENLSLENHFLTSSLSFSIVTSASHFLLNLRSLIPRDMRQGEGHLCVRRQGWTGSHLKTEMCQQWK